MNTQTFQHVNYLWDESHAATLGDDQVALFLYRSNLLGADLRITNFGGGNTSCKTWEKDPLSGAETEIMWIKGSGGDIGTLNRSGIAGLYTDRLRALKTRYSGIDQEDDMVKLLYHCLFDLDSRAPSIDTPLHGFLPFNHIDHLHPDALIAVAAAADSEAITQEIWGNTMGWVPWQRPGFDLGLQLAACLEAQPHIRGIVLGGHGVFTWGDTSYECYLNSLEVIEQAARFIEDHLGTKGPIFGGAKIQSLDSVNRQHQAAQIAPILRGLCASQNPMIGHFSDDEKVLEFINSHDLERLAPMGTSCPDHFLRTKIQPLVLNLKPDADLSAPQQIKSELTVQFENYRREYAEYYDSCKHSDSPPMRDPNPVVILYPGVGMFTFAKNKKTARVAAEFYLNAINVMRGAEAISSYTSLSRQEAFNIEYWQLEEDKLNRLPPEQPLSRKVALVTGAAGGIGKAIADKLAAEGACVFLTDLSEDRLEEALKSYGKDQAGFAVLDVTDSHSIQAAMDQACLKFGGVDIVVHSAGMAISKPLADHSLKDWDLLQDVMPKGQFMLAQAAVSVMRKQQTGGDIVNIVSKNGLVSGPNNVGYGSAKAAQQHLSRLLAAELAGDGIRVNVVNPDAVIVGSKIWEGKWAEGRAKAYGISVEDLPKHYAQRNLLKEIILPEDIANGVYAFLVCLPKTTGNMLNVDGGIPAAFPR
ncbi:bifunctional aldolase/short-chain dehydrogenase [Pontibacter sp. G13]|uniref:bifunctional aldolase/short-chain dehydrogenase n=1 Tax=Pontibacter sp. G13 TaxID=3074898 RepID=UPI002889D58B|nr:bifunctional aldolase/short-chain dehydrogenase [Pontibacter sp. G13]WNJ19018.1 bifunctional aldolase/short-chain dehydrogenase [Pontibacter sp. G13]